MFVGSQPSWSGLPDLTGTPAAVNANYGPALGVPQNAGSWSLAIRSLRRRIQSGSSLAERTLRVREGNVDVNAPTAGVRLGFSDAQLHSFKGAAVLASLFKVMALVTLVAGALAALVTLKLDSGNYRITGEAELIQLVMICGTALFVGGTFGFFAYVLDLLRAAVSLNPSSRDPSSVPADVTIS